MRYFATNGHRASISSDINLVKTAISSDNEKYNRVYKVQDDRVVGNGWHLNQIIPTDFSWQVQIHLERLDNFLQSGKELPYCGVKENGLFLMNYSSCVVFKGCIGSLPQERVTFQSSYFKAIVSELKEMGLPIMEIAGNGTENMARFSLLSDDRVYHYLMPCI